MKNVLVTGGTGFIGSKLVTFLMREKNIQVINLGSVDIIGTKTLKHNNYTFTQKDFIDKGILEIDSVIHLGAFIPKSSVEVNNITKCNSNIINTEHLIKNLPSLPKKIIYISTVDVYESSENEISENSKIDPVSFYGQSKLYCEKMLEVWSKQNNVILQILRLGHIYGEGELAYKKFIPTVIQQILQNNVPSIYSNGLEKRAFLHVDDCVSMIIKSLSLEQSVGPINIVSKDSLPIIEYANKIISLCNKNIVPEVLNKPTNTRDITYNTDKMYKFLGEPIINIDEGLKREIEYFIRINKEVDNNR